MNRIKRTLAIFVAAIMLQSLFAFGAAADTENNAADLSKLRAFGIIESESLFDSDSGISRADYTVMIAKAGNIPPTDSNTFVDIASDDERAGYIDAARKSGIVNGVSQSMFAPERGVTAVEAAKMALRLIGYDKIYDLSSDSEVISRARGLKLFGANIPSGYITGEDAAVILDNLLDVKKFVVFSETNSYSLNSVDKTVAEEFFGLTKFRGEVLEVYRNKNKAAIRSLDDNTETVYSMGVGVNIEFVFGTQYFYADMSTKTIVYADNENSELIYDYIDSVNNVYDDDYFNIAKLKKISFKNSGKYTVADDVCVYIDGARVLAGSYKLSDCFVRAVADNGSVEKLEIFNLTEGGLIYRADKDTIKYADKTWADNTLHGFEALDNLNIVIDGVPGHKMTDLKADYVFDYYKSDDVFMIVSSSRKAVGNLDSVGKYTITVNGEKLDKSEKHGVLIYSIDEQKYFDNGDYSRLMGTKVSAYIDDNKEVRFVRDYIVQENANEFVGLVVGSRDDAFKNYLKVQKITGGAVTALSLEVKEKLAKDSLSYDYAKSTAKAYDGSNLFTFTVNSKSEITKIEHVKYFGSNFFYKNVFSDFGSGKTLRNIYCGDAVMFAVFDDIDTGEYTVRLVDASFLNSSISSSANGVEVLSDFDMINNPVPSFVMFGSGSETMHYNPTQIDVIKEIEFDGDDMATLYLCDGTKPKVTREFVEKNSLKSGTLIYFTSNHLGKNTIQISRTRDLSGEPDTWTFDPYSLSVGEGFYKAENVTLRNGTTIQFTIDGAPSNVYMLYNKWDNSTAKVIGYFDGEFDAPQRYLTGYTNRTKSRSYMKSVLTAISQTDPAWFHLTSDGLVDFILFQSTNSVN